jgi:hypothetical protein
MSCGILLHQFDHMEEIEYDLSFKKWDIDLGLLMIAAETAWGNTPVMRLNSLAKWNCLQYLIFARFL